MSDARPGPPPAGRVKVVRSPRRWTPRGVARRIFARLHAWAEAGWAGRAVGTWNFMQGSFVPGPSDALLVPLGIADPPRAYRLAVWATAGATVGGLVAYAVGALAFDGVGRPLLGLAGIDAAEIESHRHLFEKWGALLVVGSALSPVPTKLVCVASGAFGVPPFQFFLGLLAGRGTRFAVVALLVRRLGERATRWLGGRRASADDGGADPG